ncbi:hypothetical protein H5410_013111 [Solanum commersonii]|uniref:Uncharacterized protein n=1 Tax=Solanum commersonii TaxID=4109 RepID=A0A9J6ATJ4_SOLCO|nr:hypothetical protein H5410_013111 [Solanum commersonii]
MSEIYREKIVSSFIALKKNNKNVVLIINDVEGITNHTLEKQKDSKEKLKTLKMRLETLNKKTEILKIEINDLKITLIDNEKAHKVAKAKVQELGTQLKAAQAKQREMST